MHTQRSHIPTVACPPYLQLKPKMRKAGLFACSEVGFNLALDPLARKHAELATWLSSGEPHAQAWVTPPLLRNDWVTGNWHNPPHEQWCREEPGGHLLTPRPAMHLLNRLRWHPVESGEYILGGWCFRQEDPNLTLPLLRQRTFLMIEHARIGSLQEVQEWAAEKLEHWWNAAVKLDFPVTQADSDDARYSSAVMLGLPETPAVKLVHAEVLPSAVSGAYLQDGQACACVGTGLERWLLALSARHGVEPLDWPELP